MAIEVITKEDLDEFRTLLLADLQLIITGKPVQQKQWLKSNEVRKLLNISHGTLQNLRVNGTLSFSKVGSILYYPTADIEKVLEYNKTESAPNLFKKNNL
jgi:hypothetical protein